MGTSSVIRNLSPFCVEVTGLEPATAWSQTRNATNCATPRCLEKRVQNYKKFCTRANFSAILFDNSLLYENLLECFHGSFHLLLGMCSH